MQRFCLFKKRKKVHSDLELNATFIFKTFIMTFFCFMSFFVLIWHQCLKKALKRPLKIVKVKLFNKGIQDRCKNYKAKRSAVDP
jgi:hypothetical protein